MQHIDHNPPLPGRSPTDPIPPHYPLVTRLLLELWAAGELPNVAAVDIEPLYGYVGRLRYHNGAVRLFRGTDVGLNRRGAAAVAQDKGYTKYFLQQLGYATPRGRAFVLPAYRQQIDQRLAPIGFSDHPEISQMLAYIEHELGYPCFLKPNDESKGRGVRKCSDAHEIEAVLASYQAEQINVCLVEEAIAWPEFRIVVWRDRLVACYHRRPLAVAGDGVASIAELIECKQAALWQAGRIVHINASDPRILHTLHQAGYTLRSVPALGVVVPLHQIANLSSGGDLEDWTDRIAPHWQRLCVELTAAMGLAFCGLDLLCTDLADPTAAYCMLELNASPGLDHYAASGAAQFARVRQLYQQLFNAPLDL